MYALLKIAQLLHKAAKVLAKKEHISINQLIMLALAGKNCRLGDSRLFE